jgi:hypothetical protein
MGRRAAVRDEMDVTNVRPPQASPPRAKWYGLEDRDGTRTTTMDEDQLSEFTRFGYKTIRIFDQSQEAHAWVDLSTNRPHFQSPPPGIRYQTDDHNHPGHNPPDLVNAETTQGRPRGGTHGYPYNTTPTGYTRGYGDNGNPRGPPRVTRERTVEGQERDRYVRFGPTGTTHGGHTGMINSARTGEDTSTAKDELFGVNLNRKTEADNLLLPTGIQGRDTKDQLFGCTSDVMALPGGYRNGDDFEDMSSTTGIMVAALMDQRGGNRHVDYRLSHHNGLRQIRDREDLFTVTERVHEAWEESYESQRSQFINAMNTMGFSNDNTELYLQTGVLPRIIRDTYNLYQGFLAYVSTLAVRVDDDDWRGSLPESLIKHHRNKLDHLRRTSANYRELVLQNYTYLREARRKKYYDPSLNRALWLARPAPLLDRQLPTGTDTNGIAKCSCCKKTGLTPAERSKATKNLKIRLAQKVCKIIKAALEKDPDLDHDELIKQSRDSFT